jgi:hypothetical protein
MAKLKYKKISLQAASRSNCNTVAHRLLMKYNFGFNQEAFKMKMEKKELSLWRESFSEILTSNLKLKTISQGKRGKQNHSCLKLTEKKKLSLCH